MADQYRDENEKLIAFLNETLAKGTHEVASLRCKLTVTYIGNCGALRDYVCCRTVVDCCACSCCHAGRRASVGAAADHIRNSAAASMWLIAQHDESKLGDHEQRPVV